MADVTKTVLTKFEADTSKYVAPVDKAVKATTNLNKEQKKVQDTAKDTGKIFKSSLGETADSISKVIPGLDGVASGFKKAEAGAKAFGTGTKAAIAATGIGLLVTAVTSLVSAFGELSSTAEEDLTATQRAVLRVGNSFLDWITNSKGAREETEKLTKATKDQKVALDAIAQSYTDASASQEQAIALLKAEGASREELFAAEEKLLRLRIASGLTVEEEQKALNQLAILRATNATAINKEAEATAIATGKVNEKAAADKAASDAKLEQIKLQQEAETEAALVNQLNAEIKAEQDKQIAEATVENESKKKIAAAETAELQASEAAVKTANDKAAEESSARAIATEQAKQQVIGATVDAIGAALIAQFASSKNEKKNAISASIIQSLLGIAKTIGNLGFPAAIPGIAAIAALGAINVAKIASTNFEKPATSGSKFADGGMIPLGGGMIRGPRHSSGGVKFAAGGRTLEAEGGEFIVNRKATARFMPQLNAINNTGLYADGGLVDSNQGEASRVSNEIRMASSATRTVLVLEDFRRASDRLDVVESLAKIG